MKLLSLLFLFSFGYLVSKSQIRTVEDYTFELTVNSQDTDPAKFDLMITGFSLTGDGRQIPFKIEQQNLETPYKLILKNGKYTAVIENRSQEIVVLSRVQGIHKGERMSSAGSDSNKITLEFGIGGKFSASNN